MMRLSKTTAELLPLYPNRVRAAIRSESTPVQLGLELARRHRLTLRITGKIDRIHFARRTADPPPHRAVRNDDCPRHIMRCPCTITQMSERRVREIVCRCWPELHAGRFVTAGSLAQLDRHAALDGFTPAEDAPELQERRLVPFADRRALRPRMEMGIDADDEGPFDDAA